MRARNERITLRIDNNQKKTIRLLTIENSLSMNKMFIYILELGYSYYVERFKKDNEIKMEGGHNL